ncbi:MAG: hypothetical protein ACTS4U_01565 [Candidatus Hodgkinia cicadicola]
MPTDLRSLNYLRRGLICCASGPCKLKTSASTALIGRTQAYNVKCHLTSISKPYWFSKERLTTINGVIFNKTTPATTWCEVARSFGDSLCNLSSADELTFPLKKVSKFLLVGRSNWQITLITGRKPSQSHTLIFTTCVRHHYELGSAALIGLEY